MVKNIEGSPVEYLVNLMGFRDKTNGIWKQWKSDDLKIAFIGDSVTYGEGVNYGNTFSNVIETVFSKIEFSVRVINLGIPGFNTLQDLALLKYKAIPLNPDIVMLGYFLNDTERRRTQKLPSVFQYFLRYFHFGTFLNERIVTLLENMNIKKLKNPHNQENNLEKQFSCGGYTQKIIDSYNTIAWEDNKEIILTMNELCKKAGIKEFAVVIFPFEGQIKGTCPLVPQDKTLLC